MKQSQLLLTGCVSPRAAEVLTVVKGSGVDFRSEYGIQELRGPHEEHLTRKLAQGSPYAMLVNYKEQKKSNSHHLAGNSITFRAESMNHV